MRTIVLTLSAALVLGTVSAEIHAQGRGRGAGVNSNPAAGTGSSPVAGAGLSRRPDFATARSEGALRGVGRDGPPGETGGIGRSGPPVGAQLNSNSAGNASDNEHGAAGRTRGQTLRESRGLSLHARARQQMADRAREQRSGGTERTGTDSAIGDPTAPGATVPARRAPWERAGISRADWLLAKRLASIDKLRDKALEIGNDKLLEQADKLEALARRQHAQRTGEFADPAPEDPATIPDDGAGADAGPTPVQEPTTGLTGDIVPVSDETEPAPAEPVDETPAAVE